MFDVHTYPANEVPEKYLNQIDYIIDQTVEDQTDEYWKNYLNFSIESQTAVTVGLIDDEVKIFSTVFNTEFYGKGVYRILNRLLMSKDMRESGSSKTYKGDHRVFPMIHQQI